MENIKEVLDSFDWQDLDDNPNICRAKILNAYLESYFDGLRKFDFDGVFYYIEPIDFYSSYIIAY